MPSEQRIYPHPTRPSNPNALELAIYQFELKAKKFHDAKLAGVPASSEEEKALLEKMTRDYEHLEAEKSRITGLVIAQESLKAYREACSSASLKDLKEEAHHPTDRLARHLASVGEPKPTKRREPHHIVCGKGKFLRSRMMRARLNLHLNGIGINDPSNGVWMINFHKNKPEDWATPSTPSHRGIHRYNYETWITRHLGQTSLQKDIFERRLRHIKNQIKSGSLPAQVLAPKDTSWKGI
ncbi:hypothetical protein F9L16_13175 [Agarivorans sp. B2Z047]|uniref:AHH domain-containing protein n=1 Tax=Agarivorans sp. B2Z047 TaxID=2652721 RepID=UPI00128CDD88|nr:AHH domain-containing protein [Agarivorans sp. B2Z047]MPW29940.1 hypothetical protein [Agarivorans sp. B2Z047]UQN43510.1 AHH domain-containing protein [Agarivorans sp. B2Z047]